jgi:hypothetical protein
MFDDEIASQINRHPGYDPRCEPPVNLVLRVAALVLAFPLAFCAPGLAVWLPPPGRLSFLFFLFGISDIKVDLKYKIIDQRDNAAQKGNYNFFAQNCFPGKTMALKNVKLYLF